MWLIVASGTFYSSYFRRKQNKTFLCMQLLWQKNKTRICITFQKFNYYGFSFYEYSNFFPNSYRFVLLWMNHSACKNVKILQCVCEQKSNVICKNKCNKQKCTILHAAKIFCNSAEQSNRENDEATIVCSPYTYKR